MRRREKVLPYLAKFAIPRTQTEEIEGWYSQEKEMWMIDTENGPNPAIECDGALVDMMTKKRAEPPERDNDATLELLTKTKVERERDD